MGLKQLLKEDLIGIKETAHGSGDTRCLILSQWL